MIKINDLSKRFGDKTAVKKVNFEVKDGEIFALLGPNGAGKTTTMRMLSTLLKPTAGSVIINNWDTQKEAKEIKKNIKLY